MPGAINVVSLSGTPGIGRLDVTSGLGPAPEEQPTPPFPPGVSADFLDKEYRCRRNEAILRELLAQQVSDVERLEIAAWLAEQACAPRDPDPCETRDREVGGNPLGAGEPKDMGPMGVVVSGTGTGVARSNAKIGAAVLLPAAALLLAASVGKKKTAKAPLVVKRVKSKRATVMATWGWIQVDEKSARSCYEAGLEIGVLGSRDAPRRLIQTFKRGPSFDWILSTERGKRGGKVVWFARAEALDG